MAELNVRGYVNQPKVIQGTKGPFSVFTLSEAQKQKDGTKTRVYYDCVNFASAEPPPESSFVTLSGWFSVKKYTKKDGGEGTGLSINVQKLEVAPPREGAPAKSNDDAFSDLPF